MLIGFRGRTSLPPRFLGSCSVASNRGALEDGSHQDVHEDRCGQGVGHDKDEDELEVSTSHDRMLASGSPGGKCSLARRGWGLVAVARNLASSNPQFSVVIFDASGVGTPMPLALLNDGLPQV